METDILNRLEAHDFTEAEQKEWNRLGENCTSGCGNDFDCPHEEALIQKFLEADLQRLKL